MARLKSEPLIIGIGGHAMALNADTGEELWRTKLKSSALVTIWLVGKHVYAGTSGELFCLEARTGSLLWQNNLKGLGLGLISFANGDAAAAYTEMQAQAAAASA